MKLADKYSYITNEGMKLFELLIVGCIFALMGGKDIGTIFLAGLALVIAGGSFIISLQSKEMIENEQRIRHIETSLNKFYIPLYNLLTSLNENATTQEKINEINGYIYLAEPYTCYRFKVYQQTNWFNNELLEQVKKDIEMYQKEYKNLIKQQS